MKFDIGQKVVIVDHKRFFEDIAKGKYYFAEIIMTAPCNIDGKNGNWYRARTKEGLVATTNDVNLSNCIFEFITPDYLRDTLRRVAYDKISEGEALLAAADKVMDIIEGDNKS